MQRVFEFLEENPLQYLATVGTDGKPKVRPFLLLFREGGNLYFSTGAKKDVYAELLANPYLEISVSTMKRWLRIRGRAEWVEERALKERALDASPLVKSIYKSGDNPLLKVFYVAEAEAVLDDFNGLHHTVKLN